jgi:tRNA uridine 5-carbamoylmethylation protein Kti12
MQNIFKKIILIGRPASGKSEVINFLKNLKSEIRAEKFHVGKLVEIDDFPMLWTWFEEDDILEKVFNKPRLHSTSDGYFLHEYLWHLLIERISLDYKKSVRDLKDENEKITRLIEFSRGTEHGGYKAAFSYLSKELLEESVIIYVNVPFEESLRKNRKRFNPDKPDSILEHGLPDSKLEKMYKEVDWDEITKGTTTHININGINVPYVIFENMPSKTDDFALLEPTLHDVTTRLWNIYKEK